MYRRNFESVYLLMELSLVPLGFSLHHSLYLKVQYFYQTNGIKLSCDYILMTKLRKLSTYLGNSVFRKSSMQWEIRFYRLYWKFKCLVIMQFCGFAFARSSGTYESCGNTILLGCSIVVEFLVMCVYHPLVMGEWFCFKSDLDVFGKTSSPNTGEGTQGLLGNSNALC